MDMWMKIGSAALLILMLVYLLPRAKQMLKHSPKGSSNDWMAVLIPLLLVLGFVLLLIELV